MALPNQQPSPYGAYGTPSPSSRSLPHHQARQPFAPSQPYQQQQQQPITNPVPATRYIDGRAVMERWRANAERDYPPQAATARVPLATDAAALWHGMRYAGLERRLLAGRLLHAKYGGGYSPDPETEYRFSPLTVANFAAQSFIPPLQVVLAPPGMAHAADQEDPGHEGEALAWFVSPPLAQVPVIMVRQSNHNHRVAWQIAMLLGYYTKDMALFTQGVGGVINLIPRTRDHPQLISLLHRYAEGLLYLPPCAGTSGCVCVETRDTFNRPPADPVHPGMPRRATDTLDVNILRETVRSIPLNQQQIDQQRRQPLPPPPPSYPSNPPAHSQPPSQPSQPSTPSQASRPSQPSTPQPTPNSSEFPPNVNPLRPPKKRTLREIVKDAEQERAKRKREEAEWNGQQET